MQVSLILAVCLLVPAAHALNTKPPVGRISRAVGRCSSHLTQQACLDHSCWYCESKPVEGFSGCFEGAHTAPKSFFSCTANQQVQQRAAAALNPANPSDPCEGKPDAQSCDALAECTWCKSAAVPSSCFTLAQAKFLPPAVFVCDKKPSLAGSR